MFSSSWDSEVLTGFSGGCASKKTSKEALGLGVPAPKEALELVGEPWSEAAGLQGVFPEEVLWLGVALGGGGLLGGAEVLWREALFFSCSDPSLKVRVRRTTSGRDEGCSEWIRALSSDGAGEPGAASSWDSPPSTVGEGWAWVGPLQAGRGSSSSEELASAFSSSISLFLKGSSLISDLSSPWAGSDVSSSSLTEMESLVLFKGGTEGLVGEVRGLETEDV